MSIKKYKRNSTNTTISIFYEQHCLKKYNYSPPYQRDYNVWDDGQKSYLIDTIMKNYPMPPIFLEQKIYDGKTIYDIIDGKQRLTTIVDFIENKIKLPLNFGDDIYGSEKLNGKSFFEIKALASANEDAQDFVDTFWSYVLNIEYIEKPDEKIVDSIFDRLNRGGERLNSAELRKAKYYDSALYHGILEISKHPVASAITRGLNRIRLEDISFLTEIYLLVVTKRIINGVEKDIDFLFENYVDKITTEDSAEVVNTISKLLAVYSEFDIDSNEYKIAGTSHQYALIYIAFQCLERQIPITLELKRKLKEFYTGLRAHKQDKDIELYSASMQSASKLKASRKKRVGALMNYLGIK